jgi:hypothetical protein
MRLPSAPILVILVRDGREHVGHHSVDGSEHAAGEAAAVLSSFSAAAHRSMRVTEASSCRGRLMASRRRQGSAAAALLARKSSRMDG